MRPAIFLDKDGTLIENIPYNVDVAQIKLARGAGDALRRWDADGYALVVVSNQSGVAMGRFPIAALEDVRRRLADLLAAEGVRLAGCYFCPHHPQGTVQKYAIACQCRKPLPGMLLNAARDLDLSLRDSWMIGDILDDVEAGHRAGCRAILVDNGGETVWDQSSALRRADFVATDFRSCAAYVMQRLEASCR